MKKVIAILMIAIFSLSCFSFAFADEAVEAEDAALELAATYKIDEASYAWNCDDPTYSMGTPIKFHYEEVNVVDKTDVKKYDIDPTVVESKDATYYSGATVTVKVTLANGYSDTRTVETAPALTEGVHWDFVVVTDTPATCYTEGKGHKHYYLLAPSDSIINNNVPAQFIDEKDAPEETVDLKMIDHNFKETVTYKAGTNTRLVNGDNTKVPEVIDQNKFADYVKVVTRKCQNEGCTEESTEEIPVTVQNPVDYTTGTVTQVVNVYGYYTVDEKTGVATVTALPQSADGTLTTPVAANVFADYKLILKDCEKEASYIITYLHDNGKVWGTETVDVPAGHVEWQRIELADAKDKEFVKYDDKNEYPKQPAEIKNLTCNKEVKYNLITTCLNPNCIKHTKPLAEQKTLAPDPANHKVNSTLQKYLADNKYTVDFLQMKNTDPYYWYKDLKENAEKKYSIRLSDEVITHTKDGKDGSAKVQFVCWVCQQDVGEPVDIVIKAHKANPSPEVEYSVIDKPTCTAKGKALGIVKCLDCGQALSEREEEVAMLPHTNDEKGTSKKPVYDIIVTGNKNTIVDNDGALLKLKLPADATYPIGIQGYQITDIATKSLCEICGGNPKDVDGTTVVKITKIVPNDVNTGAAGKITIKATYTEKDGKKPAKELEITADYFDSMTSFLDRKQATAPDPEVKVTIEIPSPQTFAVGETRDLDATFTPAESATARTWESDNPAVATVSDGKVTAVKPGTAYIKVTVGEASADCKVIVEFSDNTDAGKYYYNPVNWAAEKDIIKVEGTEANVAKTTTRGEVVTFLYRQAGCPAVSGDMPFTDVPEWCHDAVLWAWQNNITTGYKDGKGNLTGLFGANDPVTREQVITFQWRAAGADASAKSAGYTDVKANSYYEKAVDWGTANGIVQLTSSKFGVGNDCTRGMVVTWIYRATK